MIYVFIAAVCLALIALALVSNYSNGLETPPQPLQPTLNREQYIAMCLRREQPTSLTMQASDPDYSNES